MENRINLLHQMGILSRANSFLIAHNFTSISNTFKLGNSVDILDEFFITEPVASVTNDHLERLYFHSVYNSDGPFNLIDFLMETWNEEISNWVETKLSKSADEIEAKCKKILDPNPKLPNQISNEEVIFLDKWRSKQPQGKSIDSDVLACRVLETLILLAIIKHQHEETNFNLLENRLTDWSEAAGLIRSLSDSQFSLADTTMDIDFNPSADISAQISAIFSAKQNDFDIYLLERFKEFKKIREIVEIVAERCGIPVDSDFEDEKQPTAISKVPIKKEQPSKHWRRVKPISLPVKRVNSSSVNRPSSLSTTEMKSNRFLSTSSSRQVDVTIKPIMESNNINSNQKNRRRHSEASAPQIIQHTTPTKSRKAPNSVNTSITSATAANTSLPDAFVILETPPRALTKQIPQNDLTSSVRRLFPQQSMEE